MGFVAVDGTEVGKTLPVRKKTIPAAFTPIATVSPFSKRFQARTAPTAIWPYPSLDT